MFKFGIIGAGNIAHKFCDAVRCIDDAKVLAVSSRSLDRAKDFAQTENITHCFDNYSSMLTDADLDAVYIATTHNFHYENALLCLNHDKPVLIEKPMAINTQQAAEVFGLAKQKRLFVMEAMWSRFLPHINQARNWIRGNAIGKLTVANATIGFKANPDPALRCFNPDLAGGALYDIGVYAIELITYLMEEPVRDVQAMVIRAETGVDLTDNINIRFDTCMANLQITFASNIPNVMTISGEDGYIVIPDFNTGNECMLYRNGHLTEQFKNEYENGFTYQIEETIRCIREGLLESPVMPLADTLMCCDIFEKVLGVPSPSIIQPIQRDTP